MKKTDLAIIEDVKRILQELQIESFPYLSLYIKTDLLDEYIYLSNAREWLRKAASDADEAIAFDIAAQKSKTSINKANCERMCQSKLVAMQIYYNRAMPWYQRYLKAVHCDRAELIDYIKVA